jgi:hypothetical protein
MLGCKIMFRSNLYPFELLILNGVGAALPDTMSDAYTSQLKNINKVQRLLEWNEIEFYCMSFFKVRWPEESLFQNKGEFVLGRGRVSSGKHVADVTVWAVGGHIFSIESESSLKPFRSMQNVSFILTENATQQGAPGDVGADAPSRLS